MKRLFFSLIFFSFILIAHGQSRLIFNYDTSGNLIERSKVTIAAKSSLTLVEQPELEIKVYPNPTTGFLKLEIPEYKKIEACYVTITGLTNGSVILNRKEASLPIMDIDISNQLNGFYTILIEIDGFRYSRVIIKQ